MQTGPGVGDPRPATTAQHQRRGPPLTPRPSFAGGGRLDRVPDQEHPVPPHHPQEQQEQQDPDRGRGAAHQQNGGRLRHGVHPERRHHLQLLLGLRGRVAAQRATLPHLKALAAADAGGAGGAGWRALSARKGPRGRPHFSHRRGRLAPRKPVSVPTGNRFGGTRLRPKTWEKVVLNSWLELPPLPPRAMPLGWQSGPWPTQGRRGSDLYCALVGWCLGESPLLVADIVRDSSYPPPK